MRPMDAFNIVVDARRGYAGRWRRVPYALAEVMVERRAKVLCSPENIRRWLPQLQDLRDDPLSERRSTENEFGLSPETYSIGEVFEKAINTTFEMAEVFIIRQNMCQLIEGAMHGMPEQNLLPSDPPSESGVVLFDEPFRISPEDAPIFAVSWTTVSVQGAGKARAIFAGDYVGRDSYKKSLFVAIYHDGRISETAELIASASESKSPEQMRRYLLGAPRMILSDVRMMDFGQVPQFMRPHPVFGGMVTERDPIGLRLQTLFALCRQELPAVERHRPTGRELKQLRRLDMRTNSVSVIMLRRRSDRGNEATEVQWSHRWLVRGHWRNQWYSSLKEHRLVYINPHIKGPEDKPFVMHDKVNILGR